MDYFPNVPFGTMVEPMSSTPHHHDDEGRALHPSSGQPRPEQFRRCGRHWFDAALAGCDDCGAAMCSSCIVAAVGVATLCEACTLARADARDDDRSGGFGRWKQRR